MFDLTFSIVAWAILLVFFSATVFWVAEVLLIGRARPSPLEHGHSEIQVRILTIDAERVVQGTVDSLPPDVSDVRVIAEREIEIDGATVDVVPSEFDCEATRKARAIEWARRTVPCDSTFVLYLDEDTVVRDLPAFPDADIVQLSERPVRSGSWIAYFAEIFRMGFQVEQATFPRLRYPLYAWGGGFAVKKELENELTWDVETVTEDTNFIWRAFEDPDVELAFLDARLMNQAPPTIREMIHQRRRWISGSLADRSLLPVRYQLLAVLRNAAWGLVAISPLLFLPVLAPISNVIAPELYRAGLGVQLVGLYGWTVIGYWYYCERVRILGALLVLAPVVAIVHAAGAFWALLSPTRNFRVTEKVPPKEIEDESLEEAIEHTGPADRPELLVRP